MPEKIIIYGKNTCPFTTAAREAYTKKGKDVEYHDVLADENKLNEMLKYSDGSRKVPVIVEQGEVIIGFNGRA
jgi:glutaredoxin 3